MPQKYKIQYLPNFQLGVEEISKGGNNIQIIFTTYFQKISKRKTLAKNLFFNWNRETKNKILKQTTKKFSKQKTLKDYNKIRMNNIRKKPTILLDEKLSNISSVSNSSKSSL